MKKSIFSKQIQSRTPSVTMPHWVRLTALFVLGVWLQLFLHTGWTPSATAQTAGSGNYCAAIVSPLSGEEKEYAQIAWKYFVKNYQASTGFTNSAGGYPSGSLWDIGNYLMALNAVRWLNIIDQKEFDQKFNKFLTTLGGLRLFDDALPNKVYNAANGKMTDYGNNPTERGIGWSALDIGRVLAAFHVIRTCHPQYNDWVKGILAKWQIAKSVQNGQLFGALVTPAGKTMPVQEGRLGYEEYGARGYELWGFKVPKAISFDPYQLVDIYGIKIPVDKRDFQSSGANNYVVSESYILDGIEFGLSGKLADFAKRVLQVQEKRFQATGQLTAVTEDNIDQAPYFLYNTIYANGKTWATITDENKPYPQLRSISTKAAFGWRYLYPDNPYANKVFDAVKSLYTPAKDGFYAGLYEETKQPNKSLTGNTNGLILEILYYKALGNRPLVGGSTAVSTSTSAGPPPAPPSPVPFPTTKEAVPAVETPQPSPCPQIKESLSLVEKRYAKNAWTYFAANTAKTGFVNDRSDIKGATFWGLGNYLMALHSAQTLGLVDQREFDQRVRNLLGGIAQAPLSLNELPHRGYNTQTLEAVDYGNNPTPDGNGWSAIDIGRMLTALYALKTCHPEYTEVVDKIPLDWSYLRVIRQGEIYRASLTKTERGKITPRIVPENRLGYEEYAARGFQLWGFEVDRAAVGGRYKTFKVENQAIPTMRMRANRKKPDVTYTITDPFAFYGLEFGFDPQMKSLALPIFEAQSSRYRRTKLLTAAGTSLIDRPPFVVRSSIVGQDLSWETLDDKGQSIPNLRIVSNGISFAYWALFPKDSYGRDLREATLDLYSPGVGFYEGSYEKTGKPATVASGETNALILESILYRATDQQPLINPRGDMNSPWWKAIREGDSGRGLPVKAQRTTQFIDKDAEKYWVSSKISELITESDPLPSVSTQPGAATPPVSTTPAPDVKPVTELVDKPVVKPVTEPVVKPVVKPVAIATPSPSETPSLPETPSPSETPSLPETPPVTASEPPELSLPPPIAETLPPQPTPPASTASPQISGLTDLDLTAAQTAFAYFPRNWNAATGLVNAVDQYPWTTLWDQGSALLGVSAAEQLNLITPEQFRTWITPLLKTLEELSLGPTGLPNKAYNTRTAAKYTLNNLPDPQGTSGWSALDTARMLLSLKTLAVTHPEYADPIRRIVAKWKLTQLVQDGWLVGGDLQPSGKWKLLQEGRLGYEEYAAESLKEWGLIAHNALNPSTVQRITVEGLPLWVDRRNLKNSGAGNYLTNDPYVLWGMELGWPERVKPQVENLLAVQARRYQRLGILTAVNEGSLDRPPYFVYYSVYSNGEIWPAITPNGRTYPEFRFLSTKAAFAWNALYPDEEYTQRLRTAVQNLADKQRGYFAGRYESQKLGVNRVFDVNTNAIVLESILYKARNQRPLVLGSS